MIEAIKHFQYFARLKPMFKIKVSLNFWLVKNNKIFVTNFPVKMARATTK